MPRQDPFAPFGDVSADMNRVIEKARIAAPQAVPILIHGEPGTGKLLLGRAIHAASRRHGKPFVLVACGSITRDQVVPRLFGHTKEALPSASRGERGLIEESSGGTLFLDEVGELPLEAQIRLLELLQTGVIRRLGSTTPRRVDARVMASTHHNLLDDVRRGEFNHELYYRLAVAVLRIPPLRDRPRDLERLIDYFLDDLAAESRTPPARLSAGARKLLRAQPWHGNVRELANTLRRTLLWSQGETIQAAEVRDVLEDAPGPHGTDILHRPLGESFRIDEVLGEVERHYLELALRQTAGNKARAAALLGLNNSTTLSNRMKKLGISGKPSH